MPGGVYRPSPDCMHPTGLLCPSGPSSRALSCRGRQFPLSLSRRLLPPFLFGRAMRRSTLPRWRSKEAELFSWRSFYCKAGYDSDTMQISRLARAAILLTSAPAAWAASLPCKDLAGLTIPDISLTTDEVQEGQFSPAAGIAPMGLPGFCRVSGVARPTAESLIHFEIWIPAVNWNGKFQGVGNAGWSGAIAYSSMASAIRRGYATASTDAGHVGDDLKFGMSAAKIDDWAWRAVHIMTDVSKTVIRASQGRLPAYSYFTGCSTGGAQGLTETQRFPDDYNGILASDPGNERINRVASYLWSWMAAHESAASVIPPAKLATMTEAAVEA